MKLQILALLLITSLFVGCKPQKFECVFIENHSNKIKLMDSDSSCSYANKLNNDAIPLFIYISDSLPLSLAPFYHFSSLKNQSVDKYVVLFLNDRKEFTVIYTDNMKGDSLRIKRYDFARFIYDELKQNPSGLKLTPIYKKFDEIF